MARVYVDSCIIIYLIEGPPSLREVIRSAFQPREGNRLVICCSDLTSLECRVGPRQKADDDLLGLFDLFFISRDVESIPLTRKVFDLATELRARYRLKTPDAIHLAAAINGECTELWTNDDRLSKAGGDSLLMKILP